MEFGQNIESIIDSKVLNSPSRIYSIDEIDFKLSEENELNDKVKHSIISQKRTYKAYLESSNVQMKEILNQLPSKDIANTQMTDIILQTSNSLNQASQKLKETQDILKEGKNMFKPYCLINNYEDRQMRIQNARQVIKEELTPFLRNFEMYKEAKSNFDFQKIDIQYNLLKNSAIWKRSKAAEKIFKDVDDEYRNKRQILIKQAIYYLLMKDYSKALLIRIITELKEQNKIFVELLFQEPVFCPNIEIDSFESIFDKYHNIPKVLMGLTKILSTNDKEDILKDTNLVFQKISSTKNLLSRKDDNTILQLIMKDLEILYRKIIDDNFNDSLTKLTMISKNYELLIDLTFLAQKYGEILPAIFNYLSNAISLTFIRNTGELRNNFDKWIEMIRSMYHNIDISLKGEKENLKEKFLECLDEHIKIVIILLYSSSTSLFRDENVSFCSIAKKYEDDFDFFNDIKHQSTEMMKGIAYDKIYDLIFTLYHIRSSIQSSFQELLENDKFSNFTYYIINGYASHFIYFTTFYITKECLKSQDKQDLAQFEGVVAQINRASGQIEFEKHQFFDLLERHVQYMVPDLKDIVTYMIQKYKM